MTEKLFNPILDTSYFHSDDITIVGPAKIRGQVIDAVNLVSIDLEAAAQRNIGYIRENIAARKARDAGN